MLQHLWLQVLDSHSPQAVEFWGALSVQLIFLWLLSFLYLALDVVCPQFSHHHKLQPQLKQPTTTELRKCLRRCGLVRYTTDGPVKHNHFLSPSLPTPSRLILDLLLCVLLREILFYYAHRFLHLPAVYKKIHKVHHEFTAPVGLVALYAHPYEHAVVNGMPLTLSPTILRCHIMTYWVFMALVLTETTTVHSGYNFFGRVATMHDRHHESSKINFGTIGLMDWIHGTHDKKGEHRMEEKIK